MKIEYKDYRWVKGSTISLSIDVKFEKIRSFKNNIWEYDEVLIRCNNYNEADIMYFKNDKLVSQSIHFCDENFKSYINQLIFE